MNGEYVGVERRQFLRYTYDKPIRYKLIDAATSRSFSPDLISAISRNLSASGILFVTEAAKAPNLSSLLVLYLDYRTANICTEIEEMALIIDNKLIGRVVRLEDNGDGTMGIGVAFVNKTDPVSKNVDMLKAVIEADN